MKNKTTKNLIEAIDKKYNAINQDKNVYLEGLLHSKTINYWDYVHTDALLNLQIQRTNLPDEMVFIGYHQINELIFKMILWELQQVAEAEVLEVDFFTNKLTSFWIIKLCNVSFLTKQVNTCFGFCIKNITYKEIYIWNRFHFFKIN